MMHPVNHVVKAGLDATSFGLAIGAAFSLYPWILAIPSFIYASIQIFEWMISKFKK